MKIIIQLALAAVFFGCSAKSPDTVGTIPAEGTSATQDSIPFPVYMGFSEFEPLLHFSNDTTYVINFWATWCKPCVAELPIFYEKLIPAVADKPVKVLLVSMDFPKDIQKKLIPFVAERRLEKYVVALGDLDYNSWIDKVSTEWDGAIPFTLIYKKEKRVVKSGEMANYEELEQLVGEASK
ncbi:MAG: redoxin domain-containing protein [Bacteroidetes bacterium]|nr:redoxin domain-containing protein [Bacteroidota bacterium]